MSLSALVFIAVVTNVIFSPGSTLTQNQNRTNSRTLSILLASLSLTGHITPAVALGEELVRRGHQVTLCTTELEGKDLAKKKTDEAGIKLVSAGPAFMSYKEYIDVLAIGDLKLRNFTGYFSIVKKALSFFPEESNRIGKTIDGLNLSKFDMIITTDLLSHMTACLSKKYNVPGMILSTTLQFQVHHLPPWTFPPLIARKRGTLQTSDDLTFLQRLVIAPLYLIVKGFWNIYDRIINYFEFTNSDMCPLHYAALYPGVYAPQIVPTVIGFEYPRTISPLTHYVGPILTKKRQPIPQEMLAWLDSKAKNSVLYLSMGSTATLYREHAIAILSAVKATGLSAIWSLRESNQDILEGLDFDTEQLRVYKWIPQVSVLNHSSVGMALLHGGMNGVNEALYHAVPVIVVPSTNDQGDVAARLDHSKAGIQILKDYLSNETLVAAIKSIQSGTASMA